MPEQTSPGITHERRYDIVAYAGDINTALQYLRKFTPEELKGCREAFGNPKFGLSFHAWENSQKSKTPISGLATACRSYRNVSSFLPNDFEWTAVNDHVFGGLLKDASKRL